MCRLVKHAIFDLGRTALGTLTNLVSSVSRGRKWHVCRVTHEWRRFLNCCSMFLMGYYCKVPSYVQLDNRKGVLKATLCDLREEKCKCLLHLQENSSHFAAGSMAKVQVRLLPCLSFIRCRVTALKSLKLRKIAMKG